VRHLGSHPALSTWIGFDDQRLRPSCYRYSSAELPREKKRSFCFSRAVPKPTTSWGKLHCSCGSGLWSLVSLPYLSALRPSHWVFRHSSRNRRPFAFVRASESRGRSYCTGNRSLLCKSTPSPLTRLLCLPQIITGGRSERATSTAQERFFCLAYQQICENRMPTVSRSQSFRCAVPKQRKFTEFNLILDSATL